MKKTLCRCLALSAHLSIAIICSERSGAQLAKQVEGWEVNFSTSIYSSGQVAILDSGFALLLRKDKSTGISSIQHLDSRGAISTTYPEPVGLSLPAYPSLTIGNKLIPLGGNPASFLLTCSINSGVTKSGYCKLVSGQGVSQNYGVLGFLEFEGANDNEYLGELTGKIYTSRGVFNMQGVPDFSYGNLGRPATISPLGTPIHVGNLQPCGSKLSLQRKSTSAPAAYEAFLYRVDPNGLLDPRFKDGISLGSSSSSGLFSICMPVERDGLFFFHVMHTSGKLERFQLNPGDGTSTKVAEVVGLPVTQAWNSSPIWSSNTLDGRLALILNPGTAATSYFVSIDRAFTSLTTNSLVNVYPGVAEPIVSRIRFDRLTHPEFLLRKSDFSGNATWYRFEGDPDADSDGVPDISETGTGVFVGLDDTGSSPASADSDIDSLSDFEEIVRFGTNPNSSDTDGDGFEDLYELQTGFDPTSNSSTPDAVSGIQTAVKFWFNAANGISYRVEASTDLKTWETIEPDVIGKGGRVVRLYDIEGQQKRYFRARRN
jgi:hypothetical protein